MVFIRDNPPHPRYPRSIDTTFAANIEGHSLAPLLRNPMAKWDHPAFTVTRYQEKLGKSVRTERWHYVEWDDGKAGAMLFDHSRDPLELKNLAGDPAFARRVEEMKRLLKQLPFLI